MVEKILFQRNFKTQQPKNQRFKPIYLNSKYLKKEC